jgi:hypothetical protein
VSTGLFDASKHRLEEFAFTFATGAAIRLEKDKPRQCRMPYLLGGEPAMNDSRRFRMPPEDIPLILTNARKRLTARPKGGIPQLFEHGWGMYGGKAGGYALDVYEEGGDIWYHVLLDERTWEEAVDPGLCWFSRSAGFFGWIDEESYIRCTDPFEGSFTNFPAMKGLGAVESMAQLEQRFSSRTFVAMGSLFVPQHLAAAPAAAPEGQAPHAAAGGSSQPSTSPAEASHGKEQEMKLSAETLKLLGFDEGAEPTQELIDKAFKERLNARAAAPPDPPAAEGGEKPLTRGEMLEMLESIRKEDRQKSASEIRAELEARERDRQIDTVLLEAENAGRITAFERDEWKKSEKGEPSQAQLLGPERLKKTLSRFSVNSPTRPVFQPGDDASLLGQPSGGTGSIAEMCQQATEVYQYARRNGITPEAARAALRVN